MVNRKKTQRLYRGEGLSVRKRKGRKRETGKRAPIFIDARPNALWSVDFVPTSFPTGGASRVSHRAYALATGSVALSNERIKALYLGGEL